MNEASQIGIAEKYRKHKIKDEIKDDNIKHIFYVFQTVEKILYALKVKNIESKTDDELQVEKDKKFLSHTTHLPVLKQLLPTPSTQKERSSQSAKSTFRLCHIVYSNDPTEGDILFKILGIEDKKETFPYAMLSSFSGGDSLDALDDINMWVRYGGNAEGVSLLFKKEDIVSYVTNRNIGIYRNLSISYKKNTNSSYLSKLGFYKVHYIDVSKHKATNTKIEQDKDSKLKTIDDYLKDIEKFLVEKIKPKEKNDEQEEVYKETLELLSVLRYLIKDKSYEDEKEYRLIYVSDKLEKYIKYDENDPDNDTVKRIYMEEDIISILDSVMVGAKVPPAKALEIQYSLQMWEKTEDVKVTQSSIPYR